MLSFYENPSDVNVIVSEPAALIHAVAETVSSAIEELSMVLAVNVHGQRIFQQPKQFPKQMLERSGVLYDITRAGLFRVDSVLRELLPPSPLDGQHLNEWRETADYAATTLAVLAGIVDLETGFHSPLLGG
jgi:hypothetical protein